MRISGQVLTVLIILLSYFGGSLYAQKAANERAAGSGCGAASGLNGVYRIVVADSDKLYSVIEGATSNVPYNEQQQFFMDLAVRLTPPDLLAIECRENRVSLGSSRSQRIDFIADGVMRSVRGKDGRVVHSRIAFEHGSLIFTSGGGSDDNLNFSFTPMENGRRLRVTRRISSRELIEPVVIQTVYNKTIDVARWDVFDNAPVAGRAGARDDEKTSPVITARRAIPSSGIEGNKADAIREALNEWIAATNRHNIEKQMSFYLPELKAFYLARNTSRDAVRVEKTRAFAGAKLIDIRAAEPEIVFQDSGQTAIMRFRKKYRVESDSKSRSGEVVQELRWQRTNRGWKIFSERDIKVIS